MELDNGRAVRARPLPLEERLPVLWPGREVDASVPGMAVLVDYLRKQEHQSNHPEIGSCHQVGALPHGFLPGVRAVPDYSSNLAAVSHTLAPDSGTLPACPRYIRHNTYTTNKNARPSEYDADEDDELWLEQLNAKLPAARKRLNLDQLEKLVEFFEVLDLQTLQETLAKDPSSRAGPLAEGPPPTRISLSWYDASRSLEAVDLRAGRAVYDYWKGKRERSSGPLLQRLWFEMPWKVLAFPTAEAPGPAVPKSRSLPASVPFEASTSTAVPLTQLQRLSHSEALEIMEDVREDLEIIRTMADRVLKRERLKRHLARIWAERLRLDIVAQRTVIEGGGVEELEVVEGVEAQGDKLEMARGTAGENGRGKEEAAERLASVGQQTWVEGKVEAAGGISVVAGDAAQAVAGGMSDVVWQAAGARPDVVQGALSILTPGASGGAADVAREAAGAKSTGRHKVARGVSDVSREAAGGAEAGMSTAAGQTRLIVGENGPPQGLVHLVPPDGANATPMSGDEHTNEQTAAMLALPRHPASAPQPDTLLQVTHTKQSASRRSGSECLAAPDSHLTDVSQSDDPHQIKPVQTDLSCPAAPAADVRTRTKKRAAAEKLTGTAPGSGSADTDMSSIAACKHACLPVNTGPTNASPQAICVALEWQDASAVEAAATGRNRSKRAKLSDMASEQQRNTQGKASERVSRLSSQEAAAQPKPPAARPTKQVQPSEQLSLQEIVDDRPKLQSARSGKRAKLSAQHEVVPQAPLPAQSQAAAQVMLQGTAQGRARTESQLLQMAPGGRSSRRACARLQGLSCGDNQASMQGLVDPSSKHVSPCLEGAEPTSHLTAKQAQIPDHVMRSRQSQVVAKKGKGAEGETEGAVELGKRKAERCDADHGKVERQVVPKRLAKKDEAEHRKPERQKMGPGKSERQEAGKGTPVLLAGQGGGRPASRTREAQTRRVAEPQQAAGQDADRPAGKMRAAQARGTAEAQQPAPTAVNGTQVLPMQQDGSQLASRTRAAQARGVAGQPTAGGMSSTEVLAAKQDTDWTASRMRAAQSKGAAEARQPASGVIHGTRILPSEQVGSQVAGATSSAEVLATEQDVDRPASRTRAAQARQQSQPYHLGSGQTLAACGKQVVAATSPAAGAMIVKEVEPQQRQQGQKARHTQDAANRGVPLTEQAALVHRPVTRSQQPPGQVSQWALQQAHQQQQQQQQLAPAATFSTDQPAKVHTRASTRIKQPQEQHPVKACAYASTRTQQQARHSQKARRPLLQQAKPQAQQQALQPACQSAMQQSQQHAPPLMRNKAQQQAQQQVVRNPSVQPLPEQRAKAVQNKSCSKQVQPWVVNTEGEAARNADSRLNNNGFVGALVGIPAARLNQVHQVTQPWPPALRPQEKNNVNQASSQPWPKGVEPQDEIQHQHEHTSQQARRRKRSPLGWLAVEPAEGTSLTVMNPEKPSTSTMIDPSTQSRPTSQNLGTQSGLILIDPETETNPETSVGTSSEQYMPTSATGPDPTGTCTRATRSMVTRSAGANPAGICTAVARATRASSRGTKSAGNQ